MSRRWKPVRSRWSDTLTQVRWDDFERRVAEYYRGQGYRVDHSGTGASHAMADGGIDLKLYRDGEYTVVQCKHWNAGQVPHNAVHELIGVMHTEGAQRAILITSGEFTDHAMRSAAKFMPIQLIGGSDIRAMLGPIPEIASPTVSMADMPSWVAGPRRTRKNITPSARAIAARFLFAVAISVCVYLYATHAIRDLSKRSIPAAPPTETTSRANLRAPTARYATLPSDYYSRLTTPPTVSHRSYTAMAGPGITPQPAITTPDGKPVATGSTPTSDAEIAIWKEENARSMKILEKTTPELGSD